MNRSLIVGYGYLGHRVAQLAVDSGDEVFATTRQTDKFADITAAGCQPILLDWNDRASLSRLPSVDRVVVAVSYDRHSRIERYESMVGGLSRLIGGLSAEANLCYISTTGVYHQKNHLWVDETSTTRPTRDGGKAHLAAEAVLRRQRPARHVILRLSGIYGPGRIPRAADVRQGRPIASPADGYLNLIHVDDAAAAVIAAWDRTNNTSDLDQRRLYVVSDDRPVVRRDFYQHIADHYDAPDPTFAEPTADAPARFRSDSSKRIWNRRMKRDLLPRLNYPDYRAGLSNALPA